MQLRGFLMLLGADGWNVVVCRDLDAMLDAWQERRADETGVLHLGFDRPPSDDFSQVALEYRGRMLLTGAARFGLPAGFDAHIHPVGDVDGLPIYLATRGFGYTIADVELPAKPAMPQANHNAGSPKGWLAMYVAEVPNDAGVLAAANIHDDASYLANEIGLERSLRQRLGEFRFRHLIGLDDSDPARIARCAPPWLQSMNMHLLPLTVRIKGTMRREKLERVGELAKYEPAGLFDLPNFGRTSYFDLRSVLLEALAHGPRSDEDGYVAAEAVTMLEGMRTTFAKLRDRECDILVRRMGLRGRSETLEQIGHSYGITRERVRQIEAGLVRRIIDEERWDNLLTRKLEALLEGREHPLPVVGVEAIDPWFAGIAENEEVLSYILANMCGDRFQVVEVDGVAYFATFDPERWSGYLREAKAILKAGASAGWEEAHCQALVSGLLEVGSREFSSLLWDCVRGECHFAEVNGHRTLTAFGRSAEAIVEAVLSESPAPLHYNDIAELVNLRIERNIDVRRIHTAAYNVGFQFGRGTYGLEKHCHVADETRAACIAEVERIVREGPAGRQWHCAELCSLLADEGIEEDGIDKYALEMFLRQAASLERLGRLTWASKAGSGRIGRTDIRQAIVAILRDAGKPLSTREISVRLDDVRGTNEPIAIWNFDPVVRVERGVWGLNDRDVPISREAQSVLFDKIARVLFRANAGMHVSDLMTEMVDIVQTGVDADLLCALAVHHRQIKINSERVFYLPEWGTARREMLRAALEAVLEAAMEGATLDYVVAAITARTGYAADRGRVSALLQKVGRYDPATLKWFSLKHLYGDDDEEMLFMSSNGSHANSHAS